MIFNELWNKNHVYQQFLYEFKEKKNKQLNLKGLQGSAISFFIASLAIEKKLNSSLLLLTDNTESALHFFQDIGTFTGLEENKHIFFFPSFEVLPYEDVTKDTHIMEQRINVLSALAFLQKEKIDNKQEHPYPLIIVSTYRAILPRIISCRDFHKQYWKLERNEYLPTNSFLNYLINQGFQSTHLIEYQGQFSQRGGIIDLFPFNEKNPIRIELDDDRIESIRFFSLRSQRSIKKIDKVLLLPQRELINPTNDSPIDLSSFFDYLPPDTDIFVQQYSRLEKTIKEFEAEAQKCYLEKKQDNNQEIMPPNYYYLNWKQIAEMLYQKNQLITLSQWEDKKYSLKFDIPEFKIETNLAQNYFGKLDLFFEDVKKWQQQKINILVLTANKGRAMRLAEIFDDRDMSNYQLTSLSEVEFQPGNICLSYGQVNYGFSIPSLKLLVITDQEIFGRERDKSSRVKKYPGKPFYSIDELKIGDYVVHIQHGIGRYAGIQSRETEGVRKDYLRITYAADDELYVPVDQLNLVHKYIGVGGQPPKLYRLGGSSWKRVKRKVQESIQKVARELFELYRKRKSIRGFSFSTDSVWQQELEMAFPFEETPDQGKALLDVKKDMESSQPMERLICGDVGYGKTEIAIRAAFKAVMDGKQVAVLAPTTILAQQHWENFTERMRAFPVKVDMLSRFKSKKEQQDIIDDLEEGKIDIIVGTHRLVQNDIIFHDLGLLVVDEEQRFGVIHKERIKKLKEQVDSLTLTATPIPRTLYFSIIGVREMSLINTPPELRLPIITYLKEKTEGTIREAIRREIERGGQIYYVHNRVQDIDYTTKKLKQIVPEARIVAAHGQMPEEKLENIMIDFLNRKYDMLVCTTIIEIGLDISNVNTIIIDEAHQFGLAQLYQLRGRVGRSDRRAYAYLLYPSKKILTDNAKKRLHAIKEFSDLGSGFRLAMRDLEIRGAGNLLGKEQHGFVSEIGFNFYCQLLENSIDELKQIEAGKQKDYKKEPEMEVRLSSAIPDYYITDSGKRVAYYQKLSQAKKEREVRYISEELKDIYGPYPEEVQNLLIIITMKLKLQEQGVNKIRITPRYFSFQYQPGTPVATRLGKININRSIVRHYKRGTYSELRLYSSSDNKSISPNHILYQADRFLDKLFPHTD